MELVGNGIVAVWLVRYALTTPPGLRAKLSRSGNEVFCCWLFYIKPLIQLSGSILFRKILGK